MIFDALLTDLLARLPELEWQLGKFGLLFSPKLFPHGLFRCHPSEDIKAYSNEIKADIRVLTQQENNKLAHYLAMKINQKVNVLVTFCQQQLSQKVTLEDNNFNLNKLTTRQQWILSLEEQISLLTKQKEALANRLSQTNKAEDKIILKLKAELGQIQKQLTLAEEAYHKALN
ncbi:hypothetical protein ACNVED_13865 [Legionella sp. D16C41]|uniref:hypothetical protein n=1 Tax=Legionella sp. D16C41 TaxID=3402688 RepID=UPI003AF50988